MWLFVEMGQGFLFFFFFTDDSVLFCRAKEEECRTILDILAIYERGLGQKINRDKN